MGANTSCKGKQDDKPIAIAILGLDNAGKTTTVKVLEGKPSDSVPPTVGYQRSKITHKNLTINLVDLGGGKGFRNAWRHYYDDSYGFIYVVDSSEIQRIDENRSELEKLLQEEKVKGKPVLILANKQDLPDALEENDILRKLNIEKLVNQNKTLCRVELCTARSLAQGKKMDESVKHGFDWLIKTIYDRYEDLHRRVGIDVQKRQENEEKEKKERAERVQKIREERAKEKGEGPEDDDSTFDKAKDPYVPIHQAVKNAENPLGKPPTGRSNKLDPLIAKSNGHSTRQITNSERKLSAEHATIRDRRHSSNLDLSDNEKQQQHDVMSKHFSEEELDNFRQCFQLFAPQGYVDTPDKLSFIMRSLKMAPTIVELKRYFHKYKKDSNIVEFDDLLKIVLEHRSVEKSAQEILQAFQNYDQQRYGYIDTKELRRILTQTGEKLTDKDVDLMLRELNVGNDGRVFYENLVQMLTQPLPTRR
ncbi:unnamed protein product [Didymodactylos carnosus]|uniref:EF-hand domain-containing protein n=1 Tax=Didymodactylos carnosus TaxID=1234261 RepID=A0A813W7G9_9BILA|nr:unnamed protein product [Didymodactylos carnosus]CAF0851033.1 unnamed protein product [Didymodactylos carnosus]CAF3556908.1 unnamed protein product [Didymodactylos carnosus]CAF3638669.1 unnamed protein product [Didymodactylos carnosus]